MKFFFFFPVILGSILFLQFCSAFDDYYPNSGEFCDLSENKGDCFEIFFDKKLFIYKGHKYPLISYNRASYQTILENKIYHLRLLSENRIEFDGPNGRKIYNRKKKLRS